MSDKIKNFAPETDSKPSEELPELKDEIPQPDLVHYTLYLENEVKYGYLRLLRQANNEGP